MELQEKLNPSHKKKIKLLNSFSRSTIRAIVRARPDCRACGAMAARLTPDQKVGRSTRSGLISLMKVDICTTFVVSAGIILSSTIRTSTTSNSSSTH